MQITVYVTPTELAAIDKAAQDKGLSRSRIIRDALKKITKEK